MWFDSRHPGAIRPALTRMRVAWPALVALAVVTSATARPGARRAEHAGISVRFVEGSVHGFVELRTADGSPLAGGDLIQSVRDRGMESRLVFHFPDGSVFEETVAFSQDRVFAMQTYRLVQRGPVFSTDLDATLSRSGAYIVTARSHRDGEEHRYTGTLDLPPDVSNGLVITFAKNLAAGATETVHMVAFTPQPRLIGLEFAPSGSQRVLVGRYAETAIRFTLTPRLGPLLGLFARVMGKVPPDSHIWIVGGDAPAFVRFEGPLYTSGPVWRIDQTTPVWPP
jgi:hypothetical protein